MKITKMDDKYIKIIFGNNVEYIWYNGDNKFLTSDTCLTIVYRREDEIPDTQITLKGYLEEVDNYFKNRY